MDKRIEDIVKARIKEKMDIGVNMITDSDITDMLEKCEDLNISVTRKELEDYIDKRFVNHIKDEKRKEFCDNVLQPYYNKHMKDLKPEDLYKILKEDYNEGLLKICGGMFEKERVYRCEIALLVTLYFMQHWDKVAENLDITELQDKIQDIMMKEQEELER